MSRAVAWIVLCCILGAGCEPSIDYEDMDDPWVAVDRFNTVEEADAAFSRMVNALPIDSLQLRRLPCAPFSPEHRGCAAYAVTIRRDGSADYEGNELALMAGRKHADDALTDFIRLCQFIEGKRLIREMNAVDPIEVMHMWLFELRIWEAGRTEPLFYEGNELTGPGDAYVLRMAMDGLVSTLDWEEPPN